MSFEMNRSLHDDCQLAFCWRSSCGEGHLVEKEIGPFSLWPISFPPKFGYAATFEGDIFPELLGVTESLNSNINGISGRLMASLSTHEEGRQQ